MRKRAIVTGLGGLAGVGGVAGWTLFAREAAIVLAVGLVIVLLGTLALVSAVLFTASDVPCQRLMGFLRLLLTTRRTHPS
jgi:hypothetical protein